VALVVLLDDHADALGCTSATFLSATAIRFDLAELSPCSTIARSSSYRSRACSMVNAG
jgi:hypothetical protein